MKFIFKNSMTISLKRSILNLIQVYQNKNKKLKLGYNVSLNNTVFGYYNHIYDKCIISNSIIGDFTYVAQCTNINNVKIGSFCSIGPECRLGLGVHPTKKFISTHPVFFSRFKQCGITFSNYSYFDEFAEIKIGNDVWLASRVTIVDGVKIGNGAIIASGAVVTKDVPDYAIVGGVPAKVIRYRFDKDEIKYLQETKWWDFDRDFLKHNFESMHDFDSFKLMVEKYENLHRKNY